MTHENVLQAAQHRMGLVFDHFNRVVVSVSGGKDSHVIWSLAVVEAEKRGRRIETFFLDQEA
jgi:predicted phosphoadenosine phosphosulfate sulfurtransferase